MFEVLTRDASFLIQNDPRFFTPAISKHVETRAIFFFPQVKAYRPRCLQEWQVLAVKLPERDFVHVCLAMTVCRGAIANAATRKARISRPVSTSLPATSCKAVHCLILNQEVFQKNGATSHFWWGDGLALMEIVEPDGAVMGELKVEDVKLSRGKIRVFLTQAAQNALKALREKKHLPKATCQAKPDIFQFNAADPKPHPIRGLTAKDLGRNLQGSRNQQRFLEQLPSLYLSKGAALLTDSNEFVFSGGKVAWAEVVGRLPMLFDIMVEPKDFGLKVHRLLAECLPDKGRARLEELVKQMLKVTSPLLPVG